MPSKSHQLIVKFKIIRNLPFKKFKCIKYSDLNKPAEEQPQFSIVTKPNPLKSSAQVHMKTLNYKERRKREEYIQRVPSKQREAPLINRGSWKYRDRGSKFLYQNLYFLLRFKKIRYFHFKCVCLKENFVNILISNF